MAEYGNEYGKRPLWQWIVIYLVIGGVVYAGIYYFVVAKNGGGSYGSQAPAQTQSAPSTSGTGY